MPEKILAEQCAPTLAGIKTGNLFSYHFESMEELRESLRRINRQLQAKGIRIVPVQISGDRALLYMYRPARLEQDLKKPSARQLLADCAYPEGNAQRLVSVLSRRLKSMGGFPHEIGLFLGYPPENVRGFVEHGGRDYKYRGLWKVYGDVSVARRSFEAFSRCTDYYVRQARAGRSVLAMARA